MKTNSIIMMGPLAVGKSTIALAISERINWKNYPVDRLKWFYRLKNGYDLALGTSILKENGFDALISYASQYFGPKELKTIFSQFHGVIDLGATDTYCNDLQRYQDLKELFNPMKNSFLILPSPIREENEEILTKRLLTRYESHPFKETVLQSYIEKNNEFIKNATKYKFEKNKIYTKDRTVEDICDEVLSKTILTRSLKKSLVS